MATAREVAEFMVNELERSKYLYQETVVCKIRKEFGEEFVYENVNGNPAISPVVLKQFRKFTKDTVVWIRGERCWRKRTEHDKPNSRQVDE